MAVLDLIGNTPMVRLARLTDGVGAEVLVKLEYLNPSGSIKDRIALRMIDDAERSGRLRPGMRVVEASTGNTATALALVGAVKGYPVTLYVPGSAASEERLRICRSYGAEVVSVDVDGAAHAAGSKGVHGGIAELVPRQICRDEEARGNTWWARQFSNPSNVAAHRETTGREILEQTGGRVDAFVAAVGTAGTLVGVAQAVRAANPSVRIVAVEPENSRSIKDGKLRVPVIEGISGGILREMFEQRVADQVVVADEAEAITTAYRLAREEGLFCGLSSGANVLAALRVARELGPGQRVVTVLVDSRDRYLFEQRLTT
ncbi:MAG: cysteine synthase family protein [bacterium]|nr:cysteine synthase family protein [bacterium]